MTTELVHDTGLTAEDDALHEDRERSDAFLSNLLTEIETGALRQMVVRQPVSFEI